MSICIDYVFKHTNRNTGRLAETRRFIVTWRFQEGPFETSQYENKYDRMVLFIVNKTVEKVARFYRQVPF